MSGRAGGRGTAGRPNAQSGGRFDTQAGGLSRRAGGQAAAGRPTDQSGGQFDGQAGGLAGSCFLYFVAPFVSIYNHLTFSFVL